MSRKSKYIETEKTGAGPKRGRTTTTGKERGEEMLGNQASRYAFTRCLGGVLDISIYDTHADRPSGKRQRRNDYMDVPSKGRGKLYSPLRVKSITSVPDRGSATHAHLPPPGKRKRKRECGWRSDRGEEDISTPGGKRAMSRASSIRLDGKDEKT